MQMEIIHRPKTQDLRSRVSHTIHERPARLAEIVGHHISRGDGLRLRERCQVFFTADVRDVCGEDAEVCGEHGGGDLAAVGAVADEGAEEAGALGGEGELDGAAVAGCCCGVFF